MFDIGFSEMMLIAVIALIVLGPEKLPRVARTAGHLLGPQHDECNDRNQHHLGKADVKHC